MDPFPQPEGASQPTTPAKVASGRNYDENDFKERLSDEYKILQDKIDKIGAFRFTIKGWSVTAVIAAVIAASASGTPDKSMAVACTISLGLLLMLIFFFWLEFEQVRLSRLFGYRAGEIEEAFKKIDRGKGRELSAVFPVPFTAHAVALAGRGRQLQGSSKWAERRRICKQAHALFYIVLMLLAFTSLLPHRSEIGSHVKNVGALIKGWTGKLMRPDNRTEPSDIHKSSGERK